MGEGGFKGAGERETGEFSESCIPEYPESHFDLQLRVKLEEEKRALISFVTDIDVHMRERTSFASSLPRLSFTTPRSSLGGSSESGGNRRRSLGSVLIEANNGFKGGSGHLGELKEESEDKENAELLETV